MSSANPEHNGHAGSAAQSASTASPEHAASHDHVESLLTDGAVPQVQSTLLSGYTFEARPVQYVEVDGMAVFEGDIIIGSAEQARQARESDSEIAQGVVISGERYRWSRGVVPYEIDPALTDQQRVHDAIAHWHAKTRIKLVARTAANAGLYPDYVRFTPSTGCWSYVGRQGGRQDIGLAAGCTVGSTIHEIGHAVGLWHEQSRGDRNDYVTVNYANITTGLESNFNQHISDGDDVGPYDYDSIMHYPRKAFSKNGLDTIVPKRAGANIGQRLGLSAGDIAAVRYMYPNLEPSTQWLGLQFTGKVPANSTRTWFTFRWPAHWYVSWIITPQTPGAQVSHSVKTERSGEPDNLLTYYISVTNHSAVEVSFEGRYVVHGWTPAARDAEADDLDAELSAGAPDPRRMLITAAGDTPVYGNDEQSDDEQPDDESVPVSLSAGSA